MMNFVNVGSAPENSDKYSDKNGAKYRHLISLNNVLAIG